MAGEGGYSAKSKGEGASFSPQHKPGELAEQLRRQYLAESCIDCGEFGPWGDGKFFYCKDHAPESLRFPAKFFEARQRGSNAG